MYEFKESPNGLHQIGGGKPSELIYPENKFKGDFQYVGNISTKQDIFNWLPYDLHLICPIYLNIDEGVFLDYTNPLKPQLLHPEDSGSITSEYDELIDGSYIEFEAINLMLEKVVEIDDMECYGVAGKPTWLQDTVTPLCPKSGKKMKFVCQLMTFGEVSTKTKNFDSKLSDFDHMCFWGDGSLYVFMNPNENTVCYLIQST